MKNLFLLILFLLGGGVMAQERQVQGIVFDNVTKQRLNRVYIYNTRTDKGMYNNTRGEFSMNALQGDTLIVALPGYRVDTTTVKTQNTIVFYLTPVNIVLKEVVIRDSVMSPDKRLEETRKVYNDIYQKGNSKDILSVGSGGVGVSVNALYSMLSREGKNARHLQEIIERDYRDAIIDYRFTKELVNRVTSLSGEKLMDFMTQYRPGYRFVLEASDYSFVASIKSNYARYVENPAAYRLPSLK